MEDQPLDSAEKEGVSRRLFLQGAGAAAAAAGISRIPGEVLAEEARSREITELGPEAEKITLKVNGSDKSAAAPPSTTLLDFLRNDLGVTGPKRVCDRGSCGACTVLLDGRVVDSCSMLAVDAVGKEVTTVEGIGTPDNLSQLQKAFIEKDALQCGFCTPGMVVACTAILNENPKPTRDQIRDGLCGNLCRCGTYQNIVEAVESVSRTGGK
ncbi:MAG: hypothetical protein CBC13_10620 [Planctomycetia bacterium TMED53]|nr:MAG: hypothetical protein CBC13_10620 [Planctomycetia bacterium TMED53]